MLTREFLIVLVKNKSIKGWEEGDKKNEQFSKFGNFGNNDG